MDGEYKLFDRLDFDKERFDDAQWQNMLMLPIVTTNGTFVLTVAGYSPLVVTNGSSIRGRGTASLCCDYNTSAV